MANVKISELPTAATLTGAELVELVQSGANVQSTTADVAALGGGGGSSGNIPINFQISNYTTVLSDVGKCIRHRNGAGATYTIADSASVAYALGDWIMFANYGGDNLTIDVTALSGDIMTLAGTASTGARTLAQNGICTALCILVQETGELEWLISGTGLT